MEPVVSLPHSQVSVTCPYYYIIIIIFFFWLNHTSKHLRSDKPSPITDSVRLIFVREWKFILSRKVKACVLGICVLSYIARS
jgi:hypothetical protein